MEILELKEDFEAKGSGVLRSNWKKTGKPHLTRIIKDIEKSIGQGYGPGDGFDDRELTMEVGFLWEELLSLVFADRMVKIRIGEVELDGIVGSPDGLGPDPVEIVNPMVLEEYKCTWRSSRRLPTEDWYWMTQCRGYCNMIGVKVVVMRICYLMGNYRGSGPQYRAYRIEYDDKELWENWQMIKGHAERRGWI